MNDNDHMTGVLTSVQELTQAALDFGGSNSYSGASTSRTLMLKELTLLLASVPSDASRNDYRHAVIDENVLLKPSASTRSKTYSYLRDRFALDPAVPIFQVLRLLWDRDQAGQPLMALLVAAFRDPVLRATVPLIIDRQPDQVVPSRDLGRAIDAAYSDKLNSATLKTTAERAVSSYRQSGHLWGRSNCKRQRVSPTPGSTTIALLLATLGGGGGKALLESDWVALLDSPGEMILSEARVAASRGWLELRHAGDVLEITFHKLLESIGAPS